MYQFIKNLNERQCLVQKNGNHYVVSENKRNFKEVLVFPADASGEITDWMEIDSGFGGLEKFMKENVIR